MNPTARDESATVGLLDRLFRDLPIQILILDAGLRCLRANRIFWEVHGDGIDGGEAGLQVSDLIPELAPQVLPYLHRALDGVPIINVPIWSRNGPDTACMVSCFPLAGDSGAVQAVALSIASMDSMSDEQRQAVRLVKHVLLVLQSAPVVLWSTDTDLRFTMSTGAPLRRLGLSNDEVVGKTLFEFFRTTSPHDPNVAPSLRALEGELVSHEARWDGGTYDVVVKPLRDTLGNIVGTIGLAVDVTEAKRAEHQAMEAVGLLAIAAHDVRNPLNALGLQLHLMRQHLPESSRSADRLRESIGVCEKLAGKAAELLGSLLDVTQIGAGKLSLRPERVDLVALTHEAAARLSFQASKRSSANGTAIGSSRSSSTCFPTRSSMDRASRSRSTSVATTARPRGAFAIVESGSHPIITNACSISSSASLPTGMGPDWVCGSCAKWWPPSAEASMSTANRAADPRLRCGSRCSRETALHRDRFSEPRRLQFRLSVRVVPDPTGPAPRPPRTSSARTA
jgi:PAS domain S-box-containing protein